MITDEQRLQAIADGAERSHEIRNYEVSLWTLQDEFMTVLKWSDVEQKGKIQDGQMTLDIDGTESLNFSIPMYIQVFQEGNRSTGRNATQSTAKIIENPIWYNTQNGNLIASMRKVKVIFNKGSEDERVYEFVIDKVEETHEGEQLTCKVECSGLAFHELGKLGYKVSLSQDNFILQTKSWSTKGYWIKADGTKVYTEPIQNVQYWCEEALLQPIPENIELMDPNIWYYSIQMDWSAFSRTNSEIRFPYRVYEDEYVSSWTEDLKPKTIEKSKEKERPVSAANSNIYNITQNIAEAFSIHCKYQYGYDNNYHIISKVVVFYNNYLHEQDHVFTLNYPYSSKAITRSMDSTDLVTKMYVSSMEDSSTLAGTASIMDTDANKTLEDYILNFEYLHTIKAITDEQYEEVSNYEGKIAEINNELIPTQMRLIGLQNEQPDLEAKITSYKNSKALDQEQIDYNTNLLNSLDVLDEEEDGFIAIKESNPATAMIMMNDAGRYCINMDTQKRGISESSVKVYRTYNSTAAAGSKLTNEVTGFSFLYDEYGNITTMVDITPTESSSIVYMTYKYQPQNYYQSIINTWKIKLASDTEELNKLKEQLGDENADLATSDDIVASAYATLQAIMQNALEAGTVETDYYKRPHLLDSSNNIMTYYSLSASNASDITVLVTPILPNGTMLNKNVAMELAEAYANAEIDKNSIIANTEYHFSDIFMGKYNSVAAADEAASAYHNYHEAIMNSDSGGLLKEIKDTQIRVDALLNEKQLTVSEFEHMMGPALREGYWQPEDYKDYGDNRYAEKNFGNNYVASRMIEDVGTGIGIGWDTELFDEEQKLYYQVGVNETKVFYPCLNLSGIYDDIKGYIDDLSFIFNCNYYDSTSDPDTLKYTKVFHVGSEAIAMFVKNSSNKIIPVLLLIGAKNMTNDQIAFMKHSSKGKPRLGIVNVDSSGNTTIDVKKISNQLTFIQLDESSFAPAYPRIKFSTQRLKTNNSDLSIVYNDTVLKVYEDYYALNRTVKRTRASDGVEIAYPEYFITIKPEVMYRCETYTGKVKVNYALSNACISIYLDAQEIMNENSKPQVSYSVQINCLQPNILRTLYNGLAQVVRINDVDLKFENVYGYISNIQLNLDKPWEDTIEIKNYKTKFEDLFSSIVASSEAMQRAESGLVSAINGNIALSASGAERTLGANTDIFSAYFDAQFDTSAVVHARLESLFTEAGQILSDSKKMLNNVRSLSTENASILSGFAQNIILELTPRVVKGKKQPTNFKPGDIWLQEDNEGNIIGHYIAISESSQSNGTGGYARTYDGTLASIHGAKLDVDAVAGTVSILAENRIDMKSGGNIYIAANENIDMVGNNEVNIGGGKVNICAMHIKNNDGTTGDLIMPEGINLINAEYNAANLADGSIAKVLISPLKIEMGAADIVMKGAAKILQVVSDGTVANTSAVQIDADHGVWIGAGKGVSFFSGNTLSYNEETNELTPISGASVELNNQHLLLGFSTVDSNAAVEMTQKYLIIAKGSIINGDSYSIKNTGITGLRSDLVGVKITDTSIGLATQSSTAINAMLMNDNGITLGSSTSVDGIDLTLTTEALRQLNNGSYVRISGNGIELGSLAELYVNMNNFKLQTSEINGEKQTRFAIGTNLNSLTLESINSSEDFTGIVYNANGLYVHGDVYATNFILSPGVTIPQEGITDLPSTLDNQTKSTVRIYCLTDSTTAPAIPVEEVTRSTTNQLGVWALTYPSYPENVIDEETGNVVQYYYYSCEQDITEGGTVTWTTPVRDPGFTYTAQTATSASIDATSARNITDAFTANGLLSNYWWPNGSGNEHVGGVKWDVALTSVGNLLIGANGDDMTGGIWIAKSANYSDGAAMVLNKDGIALNGASIDLKAQESDLVSGVTLNSSGITIRSSGNFTVSTNNFKIDSTKTGTNNIFELKKKVNGSTYSPVLQFSETNGLTIEGALSATSLTIDGDPADEWVNANISTDTIWLGVKNATADRSSYFKITDDSIEIGTNGTFKVLSSNVIINTNADNNESIFKLTGTYTYFDLKKDSTGSLSVKIAGWTIGDRQLYSGSAEGFNAIYLDSGFDTKYGIWSGNVTSSQANFRVARNGDVYLNALMVYDPENELNTPVSERDGDYSRINFSGLNFKDAVSIKATGWSGDSLVMQARLWNKINSKTSSISAAVDCDASGVAYWSPYGLGYADVSIEVDIDGAGKHTFSKKSIVMNVDSAYISGWQAAAKDISYTSGDTLVKFIPDKTTANSQSHLDITATYNAGWNDAVAAFGTVYTLGASVTDPVDANGQHTGTYYRVSQKIVNTK